MEQSGADVGLPGMESMSESGETVILIHGLWMHGAVFLPHQHWLQKHGFAAERFSYPSWSGDLQQNVDRLAAFIATHRATRIHLVAHSLGGLIVLAMLEQGADARIRRAVLMGSPCAACHCGRFLAASPALSPLLGRTIRTWLTRTQLPDRPAPVEIGVLAGTRSFGLGRIIPGLPRPNDGVVAVAETRLPTAQDRITLPVSHSGMLLSPACAEQIAGFLKTGSFIHA